MSSKKNKNKDFLKWTRAESCFRKDNIVSTDWHERLERVPMFVPTYAKTRPEMVYIMSMEYARMWQKEKDDWFSQIFQPIAKEQDIYERRKRLKKEVQEAKRQAEIKIRERKERLAKEAEAKAKAEAEAQEKAKRIKAKLEKCSVKKKEKEKEKDKKKNKKKKEEPKPVTEAEPEKNKDDCPKGWKKVELTLQCECAANRSEDKKDESENVKKDEGTQQPKVEEPPVPVTQTNAVKPCDAQCMNKQIVAAVERAQELERAEEEVANATDNCNGEQQS